MICYKDMTFCSYYTKCLTGSSCARQLTPEVQTKAADIGLPVAQFVGKPGCFSPRPRGRPRKNDIK